MIKHNISNTSSFKNPLIQAKNLSHSFDYPLFNNVDITLHEKEVVSILGVSGSGKSTLLHILSSLLEPNSGEVFYGSKSLYKLPLRYQTKVRREYLGIIFQSHYLFKGFSVKENLEISSLISNKKIDETILKKLSIEQTINQNISDLSGGQQQRVSIARVLTKKPNIIFADEPTGNLDAKTAKDIMTQMISYIKGINGTMLIVTHDENIAKMSDTVYRLHNKKLIQEHL